MVLRPLLVLFLPLLLFGQLSSNAVTVTVSRPSNAQPGQAVFNLTVTSGIGKSLDDVVNALSGTGITAANLSGISTQPPLPIPVGLPQQQPSPPAVNWFFQFVVPFAKMKDTTAALTSLQKTIGQKNSGLSLSFAAQGTQPSAPAPNCDFAGLVNDARAQAQKIAGAAGLTPGAIAGINSTVSQSVGVCLLTVRFALGFPLGPSAPNALTVTASRTTPVQPDQALIVLGVTSGLTAGVDDITAALQGAGIAGATFTGVTTQTAYFQNGVVSTQVQMLAWSFTLTAPIAKLSGTLGQLVAAQQAIGKQNSGLALTFNVAGLQSSSAASPACDEPGLISDARAQAQTVAAAAGLTIGSILGLGEAAGPVGSVPAAVIPVFRSGDFAPATPILSSAVLSAPVPSCSLTVQFLLGS